jgi:hypothetical protein
MKNDIVKDFASQPGITLSVSQRKKLLPLSEVHIMYTLTIKAIFTP